MKEVAYHYCLPCVPPKLSPNAIDGVAIPNCELFCTYTLCATLLRKAGSSSLLLHTIIVHYRIATLKTRIALVIEIAPDIPLESHWHLP